MVEFRFFAGEEHRAFRLEGDPARRAALVHGFPGTPAEMRPLARALNAAGWTVEGLLLPGFGADIARLGSCRCRDWLDAVLDRAVAGCLLCGFSLGGALALLAAAERARDERAPAGLVLLAPFWRMPGGVQARLLPLLRFVFTRFRPFERADFGDPAVRASIRGFAPDLDPGDPAVQAALRDVAVPTRTLNELRLAGRAAFRRAPAVRCPTLIVQGRGDQVARPEDARLLAQRLGGPHTLLEVDGAHDLPRDDRPAWPAVRAAVLRFAAGL